MTLRGRRQAPSHCLYPGAPPVISVKVGISKSCITIKPYPRVYLKNKPIVNKIISDNSGLFGGQGGPKYLITKIESFVSKNFLHLYTVCKQVADHDSDTKMQEAKTAFKSIPSEIFSYLYLDDAGVVQAFGSNNSSEINASGDTGHVVTSPDSME